MATNLKIVVNSTTQSFYGDNFVNPDSHLGNARLCIRTGHASDQIDKYGLTTDATAAQYCGLNVRVQNQDCRIGSFSSNYHVIKTYKTEDVCGEENPYYTNSYCSSYKTQKAYEPEELVLDGYKITIPAEIYVEACGDLLPRQVVNIDSVKNGNYYKQTEYHASIHNITYSITGVYTTTCLSTDNIENIFPENSNTVYQVTYPSAGVKLLTANYMGKDYIGKSGAVTRANTNIDKVLQLFPYTSLESSMYDYADKYSTSNSDSNLGYGNFYLSRTYSVSATFQKLSYNQMQQAHTIVTITDYQTSVSISETSHNYNI